MDAHLLRTFVTVARLGSFSAAAAELAYTQAAVSQQIAALEADLKITLLRRRPVEPTEAGTRLLEHAVPILLRIDAARADVSRMTAPPTARLTVAMTPLAASIPGTADGGPAGALARLRARLPRLELTVRVAGRRDVAEATARGEADLGFIDGLASPSDPLPLPVPLSAIGVAESAVSVILPADHPLASRPASAKPGAIGLRSLADARWIDAPDVGPVLGDLRRVTGTDGFRAGCRYEGTDAATLLRLAAAGHGLTLVPVTLLPASALAGVAAVAVSAPRLVHRVELVHGALPAGSPAAALAAMLT